MKDQPQEICAGFAEFERPGENFQAAFSIAKAIKDIVNGDKLATPTSGSGAFNILKKNATWTLYPPGSFDDQQPDHWRLTVEALSDESDHEAPIQEKLEKNLQCIVEILRMHH